MPEEVNQHEKHLKNPILIGLMTRLRLKKIPENFFVKFQ